MEKFLVKSGVYGFIISLTIVILITDKDMHFGIGTTVLPRSWGDYIFILLRFSMIVTIIVILIAFFYKRNQKKK